MSNTNTLVRGPRIARSYLRVLAGMVERDLVVLRTNWGEFLGRTVVAPFFFIFLFTYLYPKISGGVVAGEVAQSYGTVILPGLVAFAALYSALFSIGLPLSMDLGMSREIEDRLGAPLPTSLLPLSKLMFAWIESLLAGLIVFPLGLLVPVSTPDLSFPSVFTAVVVVVMVGALAAAVGLVVGTIVQPRRMSLLFSALIVPVGYLGCVYFTWPSLVAERWLQVAVLVNPLVYMSESLRGAFTPSVHHMSLLVAVPVGWLYTAALIVLGVRTFTSRAIT